MNFAHRHLQSAQQFAAQFKGDVPLVSWLKTQFAQHKKFGSKDRRFITDALFAWYRSQWICKDCSWEQSIFLLARHQDHFADLYIDEWKPLRANSIKEKAAFLNINPEEQFLQHPLAAQVSQAVNRTDYLQLLLQEAPVFVRLRPGKEKQALQKLQDAGIAFTQPTEQYIAFDHHPALESILSLNKEVVVQNPSSYAALQLLTELNWNHYEQIELWDCCAASGGKSIAAKDFFNGKKLALSLSDNRASIIANLKKRFLEAGIPRYRAQVADLLVNLPFPGEKFNLIIADLPCSGSGTWAAMPEKSVHYTSAQTGVYQELQRRIVRNIGQQFYPGTAFLYITCAAFAAENEENRDWALATFPHLELVKDQYIFDADMGSDCMYAALFIAS